MPFKDDINHVGIPRIDVVKTAALSEAGLAINGNVNLYCRKNIY